MDVQAVGLPAVPEFSRHWKEDLVQKSIGVSARRYLSDGMALLAVQIPGRSLHTWYSLVM
jgi:hypothetical protein